MRDELSDKINLFLMKNYIELGYDITLIYIFIMMNIDNKYGISDYEAVMTIFLDWYGHEFKNWDGDSYKRLSKMQIGLLFMEYFNYWNDRDMFKFKY